MPEFSDFPDLGDDFFIDEETGVDVRTLRGADLQAWLAKCTALFEQQDASMRAAEKEWRQMLAEFEPSVGAWYDEIAALSALNWRTPMQQGRLEFLRDHIENLPQFVRRMGPPPWPKDVVDTVVVR
ncbi:hypothetical protein BAC2_01494 [uncultured bacterium]|nr:hypothetical protein BAC2_01494 [uncultured bacterium]